MDCKYADAKGFPQTRTISSCSHALRQYFIVEMVTADHLLLHVFLRHILAASHVPNSELAFVEPHIT